MASSVAVATAIVEKQQSIPIAIPVEQGEPPYSVAPSSPPRHKKEGQRFTRIVHSFRDDFSNKVGDWLCGYVPLVKALDLFDVDATTEGVSANRNASRAHLDIGSGKGALAIKLSSQFRLGRVVGVDVSKRAVDESVRRARSAFTFEPSLPSSPSSSTTSSTSSSSSSSSLPSPSSPSVCWVPPSFRVVKPGAPLPFPPGSFSSASCCFVISTFPTRESQLDFLRGAAAVLREVSRFISPSSVHFFLHSANNQSIELF